MQKRTIELGKINHFLNELPKWMEQTGIHSNELETVTNMRVAFQEWMQYKEIGLTPKQIIDIQTELQKYRKEPLYCDIGDTVYFIPDWIKDEFLTPDRLEEVIINHITMSVTKDNARIMYYGEGCEESSCSKGCRYSFTQEDFEKDSNIDIFFKREDAIKVMEERRIKALEKIQKQEEIALDEER